MMPTVSAFAQLPAGYEPDLAGYNSRTQPGLPFFHVLEMLPVQCYRRIDHLVRTVLPELHQVSAHLRTDSRFWSEIHLLR